MDVATYPTATLYLIGPISLGSIPAVGPPGQLHRHRDRSTMHGVTRSVSLPLSAERTATGIAVLAEIPITFADWDIANPECRWLRHHGRQRHPRGAAPPGAGKGQPGGHRFQLVGFGLRAGAGDP